MRKPVLVQAIDRAVMILKCFNKERTELRLSEISEMLDLNKSTVHGIVMTLKYHGLIDQDDETKKYRLGLGLLALGNIVEESLDIRTISSPVIWAICRELEETVHIGTLDDMDVVYINKEESSQSMRIFTSVGARKPAYCTAIGKVMLAYLDEDVIIEGLPEVLESFTPKTITSRTELLEELVKIRARGHAYDNEENAIGLSCIAAPIFDHAGKPKYAISVAGPTVRMMDGKLEKSTKLIKQAAIEISHKLGYKE